MIRVANAAQAMREGGELGITTGNRCVTGGSLEPGDYISVSVVDTGGGIPPHTLEEIFEPFFTTKGESGTGLGLFQVREFAREAGGDVIVTSRVGAGTEVEMLIPSVSPSAANIEAAVRSEEHTSELQSLMRISYAVFCLKKKKKN